MSNSFKRYALTTADPKIAAQYLPSNYQVIGQEFDDESNREVTIISGRDSAGWTLDHYVIPRLQSGLYGIKEIDLSHPILKKSAFDSL